MTMQGLVILAAWDEYLVSSLTAHPFIAIHSLRDDLLEMHSKSIKAKFYNGPGPLILSVPLAFSTLVLAFSGCTGGGTNESTVSGTNSGTNDATNSSARAVTCAFGTDCYCDHVAKAGDPLYDSAALVCEDWEAPTLHDNVDFGISTASARGNGGTSAYGPWYDDTGHLGLRGANNYLQQKYHSGCGTGGGCWQLGQPTNPKVGTSCDFPFCGEGEYFPLPPGRPLGLPVPGAC